MSTVTSIDASHPVGGDATNGTYGVRQSFISIKTKLNELITQYNALEASVLALPPLPPTGVKGLQILDADTDVNVFDLLNFTGLGKIIAKAASASVVNDQLGFQYGLVGTDRGWIKFGMGGADTLKINWFNLDVSGYTSLSYPLAFNSRVFCVIGTPNSIPDSSWGKNSSMFTDGMGSLTGVSVDVARGGLKSIIAIGI